VNKGPAEVVKRTPFRPDPARVSSNDIKAELAYAGARETVGSGERAEKRLFAERLSHALAQRIADALRPQFAGILPDVDGRRHESRALGVKGPKRLDVNYSTPELGLGLGLSIKTIGFPDAKSKRFTKNYTARDNELRAEAEDYHLRQPYAVMIGLMVLPVDAALDGNERAPSSFAAAISHFRHRAGRAYPSDRPTLFERFFVALYQTSPERFGSVSFHDVTDDAPRVGLPAGGLTFQSLLDVIRTTFVTRNTIGVPWTEDEDVSDDGG
jgi:hypothetical protein